MLGWLYNSITSGIASVGQTVTSLLYSNVSKDSTLETPTLPLSKDSKIKSEESKVEAILSSTSKEPIKHSKSTNEFEKRYLDSIGKAPEIRPLGGNLEKPLIPIPETENKALHKKTHPSLIIAELMARAQRTVIANEEPATLKLNAMENKLKKEQKALRDAQKNITNTEASANQWSQRTRLANYLVSGASFLTGAGLLASGVPAGAILMTSSGGALAGQVMEDFGVDARIVSATTITSGLIGLAGGISSWMYAPQRLQTGLTTIISQGSTIFTTMAGAFQSYTGYKRHQNLSEVMKLKALHTITEGKVRVLLNKLPATATMLQKSTTSMSGFIKTLTRCHKRSTDALRMAVAAFPG